jgi:hypothetical protein
MSTNPEDPFVTLISRWLAGHVDDARLREQLQALERDGLSEAQQEAVDELVSELSAPDRRRGQLQMVARETLERLALGG